MKTTIQNIALIILVINCLLYVGYIVYRYGIQKSISMSFYNLPRRLQPWFRAFIWIMSACIIVIGWFELAYIISGIGLSIVGIFPRVKVGWKKKIHVAWAIVWMVAGFMSILIHYNFNYQGWHQIAYFVSFAGIFYILNKNYIWWMEITAVLILVVNWAEFINM